MPRKLRRDATLKKLTGPARAQVIEWLNQDGEESCRQRCFSELGISSPDPQTRQPAPISKTTLYQALAYWRTEAITDNLKAFGDAQAELFAQFKPGDLKTAREFADFMMLQKAIAAEDKDVFSAATMSADSRRRLDLEEQSGRTKAEIARAKLEQSAASLKLDREKFEASMRTKLQAAYEALADEFKRNPKAEALFREAQALLPAE